MGGDGAEQRFDQEPSEHQDHGKSHHRLEGGKAERGQDRRLFLAEQRHQHQERHHRQVLEQQDGQRNAPRVGRHLSPLVDQLQDHGGRRERQHRADQDRNLDLEAEHPGDGAQRQAAGDELGGAEAENVEPHDLEAGEGEFEPDGEEEKHHPEFRQPLGRLDIGDDAETIGPDQRPGDEIAQHRTRPHGPEQRHHDHGGDEEDQDIAQEGYCEHERDRAAFSRPPSVRHRR